MDKIALVNVLASVFIGCWLAVKEVEFNVFVAFLLALMISLNGLIIVL